MPKAGPKKVRQNRRNPVTTKFQKVSKKTKAEVAKKKAGFHSPRQNESIDANKRKFDAEILKRIMQKPKGQVAPFEQFVESQLEGRELEPGEYMELLHQFQEAECSHKNSYVSSTVRREGRQRTSVSCLDCGLVRYHDKAAT